MHLGSGGRGGSKSSSRGRRSLRNALGSALPYDGVGKVCAMSVNNYLAKEWCLDVEGSVIELNNDESASQVLLEMEKGYKSVLSNIRDQVLDNNMALAILYARRFIIQIAIAMSSIFDLGLFAKEPKGENGLKIALQFWNIVEKSCSLQAAGWVGEAGAMAIASEALGLRISSNEHNIHRGASQSVAGIVKFNGENDDDGVTISSGAITQFLSNVKICYQPESMTIIDPSASLAACAEAVLGGNGGGLTVFLCRALQNALIHSEDLREVVIAVIRRSIRLLAVVEHGNDGSTSDDGIVDVSVNVTLLSINIINLIPHDALFLCSN